MKNDVFVVPTRFSLLPLSNELIIIAAEYSTHSVSLHSLPHHKMACISFDISRENEDFNQYWYSPKTIEAMVAGVAEVNGKTAFLSTPSLYFSVSPTIKANSHVFEV